MKANRHGRSLGSDETGAFPVVEAILVAVIVLSAIIFFTSIQRPTTGSEVGGLDLGQFSADTLQVLEAHEFDDLPYPDWVTAVATGVNPATGAVDDDAAEELDDFINEVLPSGAEYSLRINNGVQAQTILPAGDLPTPNGANAAEVAFIPPWGTYAGFTAASTFYPGETVATTDARYTNFLTLVNPGASTRCLQDPRGQDQIRDGPDSDTSRDTWWSVWHDDADTDPYVGKDKDLQVPLDAPLGTWRLSSTSTCNTGTVNTNCSGAVMCYVKVVARECVSDATGTSCLSPFAAYGLQLVVWFGA